MKVLNDVFFYQVDTLESLRKKKQEQEEKRRRHEKRRRKEKRGNDIQNVLVLKGILNSAGLDIKTIKTIMCFLNNSFEKVT